MLRNKEQRLLPEVPVQSHTSNNGWRRGFLGHPFVEDRKIMWLRAPSFPQGRSRRALRASRRQGSNRLSWSLRTQSCERRRTRPDHMKPLRATSTSSHPQSKASIHKSTATHFVDARCICFRERRGCGGLHLPLEVLVRAQQAPERATGQAGRVGDRMLSYGPTWQAQLRLLRHLPANNLQTSKKNIKSQ